MPKRIIEPIVVHVSKDKALKKTITYRIIVAIGGVLILSGSWLITNNPLITVLGGSIASEGFRTGVYYIHEKWWEKK